MDTRVIAVLLIVGAAVVIGAAVWAYRKRRSERLRARFGPEYDRVLAERGDRRRAEAELEARARRVQTLQIRDLDPRDRARFVDGWRSVQARFVDDPRGAVAQVDRLIRETMQACGYPVGSFDQCAADLSVTHPQVVENYRAAHLIAVRAEDGEADTEDLRQAMVKYRALFEDLCMSGAVEVRHERAA